MRVADIVCIALPQFGELIPRIPALVTHTIIYSSQMRGYGNPVGLSGLRRYGSRRGEYSPTEPRSRW